MRDRTRRWTAFAGLAAATGLVLGGTAGAQTPGDDGDESDIELTLLDHTFSVAQGGTLSLSYRIDGELPSGALPRMTPEGDTGSAGGDDATADSNPQGPPRPPTSRTTPDAPDPDEPEEPEVDGTVRVLVYPRITEVADINPVLRDGTGAVGDAIDGLPSVDPDDITIESRRGGRTTRLGIDVQVTDVVRDSYDIGLEEPGIYPIETLLRFDGSTVARHMTLVRMVPDDSTVNLAVVAGALDPDTHRDDLAALTELGDLDVPLTTIIAPDLLGIAHAEEPELVSELAGALRGAETVALPAERLDPSSAANAGLDDLFTRHLRAGEDVLIDLLPYTPVRRTVWPILDDLPSVDGANLLAQLGVRVFAVTPGVAATAVQPADGVTPGTSAHVALPDGDVEAAVIDPIVAQLVTSPPAGYTARDIATWLVSALTVESGGTLDGSIVLATGEFGVPDPAVIAAVLDLAGDAPDMHMVAASALPGATPVASAAELMLSDEVTADLRPRLNQVNFAWLRLADTSSMLPDGDERSAGWRSTLDDLMVTDTTDDEATRVIDGLLAESDRIRDAVVAPARFSFTMTSRDSDVRIRIGNTADIPLTVTVVPTSPKLTFPDGPQTVELEPNATTLVPIPVVARSNGTSELVVSITTPSGDLLADPVHLTANVNALTGLSQLVTGGAALILLTWWATHLRRRRLERRVAIEAARHPSNTTPA